MTGLPTTLTARRVTAGGRRGSSRPVIVDTDDGPRLLKLRGAAQGTGALVAEVIVAELAEALGMLVPARSLVWLPRDIESIDRDDELRDLLDASAGHNLGFRWLDGAIDVDPRDAAAIDPAERAAILWLDRLVLNPDRTVRNPNLLRWDGKLWLIDHGASLGFQYDWPGVTEDAARRPALMPDLHLFERDVAREDLAIWDDVFASRLTREALEAAMEAVPDGFLEPLVSPSPGESLAEAVRRRRSAYVAYVWKRLKPPRPFLELRAVAEVSRTRGRRPGWVTGR